MTHDGRARRRLLWPTLFTVPALAVLLGLGTWQVQRLHEKETLIAEREARLAAPPLDVAAIGRMTAALERRRVRAAGTFLHDREMHLVARSRHGQAGVHVVTPMRLVAGGHVLVDRGWVPRDRADPATRAAGQVEGTVEVVGILRAGGRPSHWTPDNQPADDVWHYVDVGAMAARAGLADARDYYIVAGDAPNPGGLPVGRRLAVEIANDHLQYAITWYALAAALAVIYLIHAVRRTDGTPRGQR